MKDLIKMMPGFLYSWFTTDFHCDAVDIWDNHLIGVRWEWEYTFDGYKEHTLIVEDFDYPTSVRWIEDMLELYIAITLEDAKDIPEISEIIEDEIKEEIWADEWTEELAWYNHARMMGWE